MVYQDVVEELVREVREQVRECGFHTAFKNAPSLHHLTEAEVSRARKEVASRLGSGNKRRERSRRFGQTVRCN